ncbi:hypothetical protein [Pseudomonas sp.]|uniref:hypothetical protein n=1 Tax=Pseudomonas sp. TaxID=306 RepID=UPI0028AFB03F|nr:hypothetical protein [Pseudomonas sp.]
MQNDPLLTADELAYIRSLLSDGEGARLAASNFLIDSNPQTQALLAALGSRAQLSLEAQIGSQRLTFPLQVIEDEFQALHLKLEAPRIFEQGPVDRPWRLHLNKPLALLDEFGEATDLLVHEVSPNGVLLEVGGVVPARFELALPLPGAKPVPLRGRLVRKVAQGLCAYRLLHDDERSLKRLRTFIFQQHRLQHPQLHATPETVDDIAG